MPLPELLSSVRLPSRARPAPANREDGGRATTNSLRVSHASPPGVRLRR